MLSSDSSDRQPARFLYPLTRRNSQKIKQDYTGKKWKIFFDKVKPVLSGLLDKENQIEKTISGTNSWPAEDKIIVGCTIIKSLKFETSITPIFIIFLSYTQFRLVFTAFIPNAFYHFWPKSWWFVIVRMVTLLRTQPSKSWHCILV